MKNNRNKKMRRNRFLAIILAAVMTIGTIPATVFAATEDADEGNSYEGKRIALISPAQHYDFFVYLCAGAKRKAAELGVEIDIYDGQGDFQVIADYISHCVAQKYDVICTGGYEAIIPAAMEANEAGIPMINFDARLDSEDVEFMARVASDNAAIGATSAQFILDDIAENGDKDSYVVYYVNFRSSTSNTQRCDGFIEVLEDVEYIELREVLPSAESVESVQTLIDDLLVSQPEGSIDYIFGSSASMGVGALASVTTAGRNEIGIVSVDDEEGLLAALQTDGPFLATVAQNSVEIGEQTIEAAVMALDGESAGEISVGVTLITKDTVDEYIEEQSELKAALEEWK